MAEMEKDRSVCLDISSRETIPSLTCRLNVPNFFTHPEYVGVVFKSPTFQFAGANWFFATNENAEDEEDEGFFYVYLVKLNSVIQQEIFYKVTMLDANDKEDYFDFDSNLFEEDENKHRIAHFYNDEDPSYEWRETLCIIIQLFCEKSTVSEEDETQNTANGEMETTRDEENCNVTLELFTMKSSISSVACMLKIPNFFILPEYDGTPFESRTLVFANAAWCFRFYSGMRWKSEDDMRNKEISFDASMVRLDSEIPEQRIFFKIALLDKNDKELQKRSDWMLFTGDEDVDFMMAFSIKESYLDRRDSLIIRLFYDNSTEMSADHLQKTTERDVATSTTEDFGSGEKDESIRKGVERLLRNLKSLLLDEQSSDVLLKIENRDFKAHKIILRARSPVFASMFQPHTKESATGVVDIPDCSASAFEILLLYIYTGSTDAISSDIVCDLYYAADKYQMDNLKSECVDFMENNLSVDNFCEIMTLSLLHNEKGLKETAVEFFCANVKAIIKTVQWQNYLKDYSTQANELYIKAINA